LVTVDKILTLGSESIEKVAGTMEVDAIRAVDEALRRWLDL
jgi:hypothetical protein